jgi:hypothetical protein
MLFRRFLRLVVLFRWKGAPDSSDTTCVVVCLASATRVG